jgi:hypothetical protein
MVSVFGDKAGVVQNAGADTESPEQLSFRQDRQRQAFGLRAVLGMGGRAV